MKYKANIIVFLAALVLLIVVVFIAPSDPGAEEFENRAMSPLPQLNVSSFFDGSFFRGFEEYMSDATAYRTSMLQFASDVERSYGIGIPGSATLVDIPTADLGLGIIPDMEDEDLYIDLQEPNGPFPLDHSEGAEPFPEGAPSNPLDSGSMEQQGEQPPSDSPEEFQEPPGTPAEPPSGHVDPSQPFSVDLQYSEDAVLYERYRENAGSVRRYADILNSITSRLPEQIRVFSLLAPIRVEFMGERYASSSDSQRRTIDTINERLDERIIRVAAYESLAAHSDEYIHFRTDHHWTALGAYYAYLSFAEAAGFEPIDISNYIEHSIPEFLGSFARGTSNRTVKEHPDTLYYYELDNGTVFSRVFFVIPEEMSRLSYRFFMGGDYGKLDFTSTNLNGRVLVVVKDSYANALIPWLAPHYERVIVIDPRRYSGSVSRLLSEFEDADLLFMNYVAATKMSDFVETIYSVR